MKLKDYIEEIPDFPVKGILFKDISPLIANYQAMSYVKASFLDIIKSYHVDYIGGIDARGFLFSTLLADALGVGSFILKEALKHIDELGERAYLESSNPRNMSLYERHGFESMGKVQIGDSPPAHPMIREPRK